MARSSGLGVLIKSIYVIVVIVVVVVAVVAIVIDVYNVDLETITGIKNNFDRKCFLVFGLFLDLSSKGVTQIKKKRDTNENKTK